MTKTIRDTNNDRTSIRRKGRKGREFSRHPLEGFAGPHDVRSRITGVSDQHIDGEILELLVGDVELHNRPGLPFLISSVADLGKLKGGHVELLQQQLGCVVIVAVRRLEAFGIEVQEPLNMLGRGPGRDMGAHRIPEVVGNAGSASAVGKVGNSDGLVGHVNAFRGGREEQVTLTSVLLLLPWVENSQSRTRRQPPSESPFQH